MQADNEMIPVSISVAKAITDALSRNDGISRTKYAQGEFSEVYGDIDVFKN